MTNPLKSPFAAVFSAEVLFNSKRITPYVLMILFAANAVLWWGWGPAVRLGWATNSDYYIARNLLAFSFLLGPPIFNAVIMGDPVLRDFRTGVDSLIFSKPVSRAQYLLGKFLGNFFVLACCQAAFPLTLLVLQAFRPSQMIVQPARVLPYFKHFFFFVVITHLLLAAFYFTVGALTRNSRIVYGLAAGFYPLYVSYGVFLLKSLPPRWKILFDAFLLNSGPSGNGFRHNADFLNLYVVTYTADMIANRTVMIFVAAICLTILYVRFTIGERGKVEKFSTLNLSTAAEGVYYPDSLEPTGRDEFEIHKKIPDPSVALPEVTRLTEGIRANLEKLVAALGVEFRLLRSERSVVVVMPLAVLISTLEVAFWQVAPDPTYSAGYAGNTARSLLIFMIGITVFYTVEAMHRDRDQRIEPILWSEPVPNYVLLLSKFLATLLVTLGLVLLVVVITIILQAVKHNGPIELMTYAKIYFVIVVPNAIFISAAALSLGVLVRDRYLTYALAIGVGAGLFYLYSQSHNHWLYNPLLFQLWDYADLSGGAKDAHILWNRIYILGLAGLFLSFAHFWYPRKLARYHSR
jgi:ABC-type transport system involved in multi-copper enzyme maturation permease subunit